MRREESNEIPSNPRVFFSCLYHLHSKMNVLNLREIAAKVFYSKDAGLVQYLPYVVVN